MALKRRPASPRVSRKNSRDSLGGSPVSSRLASPSGRSVGPASPILRRGSSKGLSSPRLFRRSSSRSPSARRSVTDADVALVPPFAAPPARSADRGMEGDRAKESGGEGVHPRRMSREIKDGAAAGLAVPQSPLAEGKRRHSEGVLLRRSASDVPLGHKPPTGP